MKKYIYIGDSKKLNHRKNKLNEILFKKREIEKSIIDELSASIIYQFQNKIVQENLSRDFYSSLGTKYEEITSLFNNEDKKEIKNKLIEIVEYDIKHALFDIKSRIIENNLIFHLLDSVKYEKNEKLITSIFNIVFISLNFLKNTSDNQWKLGIMEKISKNFPQRLSNRNLSQKYKHTIDKNIGLLNDILDTLDLNDDNGVIILREGEKEEEDSLSFSINNIIYKEINDKKNKKPDESDDDNSLVINSIEYSEKEHYKVKKENFDELKSKNNSEKEKVYNIYEIEESSSKKHPKNAGEKGNGNTFVAVVSESKSEKYSEISEDKKNKNRAKKERNERNDKDDENVCNTELIKERKKVNLKNNIEIFENLFHDLDKTLISGEEILNQLMKIRKI